MSAGQIVLLVVGILGVQALFWIVALRLLKRRLANLVDELSAELSATGERVERQPELAVYRGGSGNFPRVKGNGVVALTEHRLVFRKVVGNGIELATSDMAAVRRDKWFRRGYVGGREHVIVETTAGDELGFIVGNPDAWVGTLTTHTRA